MGWMVTRLAWIAAKLVSSKRETRYASAASWRAMTAEDWKRRSVYDDEQERISNISEIHMTYQTYLEVLSDFTDKTLERKLADEQLCGLLVATDFTKSDGTGPEPVRLLDTTSSSLW